MTKVWELLDKAYLLLNTGHIYQARIIIEKIIARDPQNIEAWNLYINTFDDPEELESLKDMVDSIWDSMVGEKDYLRANRLHILRRINERISGL